MKLIKLHAYQILDSRGNPTVAIDAWSEKAQATFSVPSGASTGQDEAIELRDGGKAFRGLGVTKAVKNVNEVISPQIIGDDLFNQASLDEKLINLDGTANKGKLGANAVLAVSGVAAKLAANELKMPLYRYLRSLYENETIYHSKNRVTGEFLSPKMFFNIINGGEHAENNLDFQETMIVPQKETVSENLRIASEVYHSLKELLKSKNLSIGLGDEGGFAPNLESNVTAIELILEAINLAGYKPKEDVAIALDVAANSFYDEATKQYNLAGEKIALPAVQLISFYRDLIDNYPIISIEDGLAEDDWSGWQMMTEKIGDKVQLIGDDLFVTNIVKIKKGINAGIANSVLIKLNQIGTLSETFEAIRLAKSAGYATMVSHRSGETEDSFIADLVIATNSGQIKSGAPARGERTVKYNRLSRIEAELTNLKLKEE